MKRCIIIIFLLSAYSAQSRPTEAVKRDTFIVGKPSPDFILHDIAYFNKKEAKLTDFRGKWLVLDFWSLTCLSCIAAFPQLNADVKEFGDKIQFMLVGLKDKPSAIHTVYAKYRDDLKLEMPCSFDEKIFEQFNIESQPRYVIIDDVGMVRAWLRKLYPAQLKKLMADKKAMLVDEAIPFDRTQPYLTNENGGNDTDFVFRSLLTNWDPKKVDMLKGGGIVYSSDPKNHKRFRFEQLGISLSELYVYAYYGGKVPGLKSDADEDYGKYFPFPIVETRDSLLFKEVWDRENKTARNRFCYSLVIPRDMVSETKIKSIIQSDLKNYFGFEVKEEVRQFPYWALVANDEAKAKLTSKKETAVSSKSLERHGSFGFTVTHMPMKREFLNLIGPYMGDYWISEQTAAKDLFIDETGIDYIDISMNCFMADKEAVLKELRRNGLDMVKKEKEMKVLVIRDPKP